MGDELDEEGVGGAVYICVVGFIFMGNKIAATVAERHRAYSRLFVIDTGLAVV